MFARIHELLGQRGVKMSQFAEAIGVSTGNVSDWKTGKARPSVNTLVRIADYLNVSVDYLVGRTDVPNTDELIDIYKIGILRWMNDMAFRAQDTAALKDNFYELLVRYKDVINALANYMCSARRRELVSSGAACGELTRSTCDAVWQPLRNMICWMASFPYDFNKSDAESDVDAAALIESLYDTLGVVPDMAMESRGNMLSEDERDLLDIWASLDKSGRRVVIGAAEDQRQRVEAERKKTNDETA